MKTCLVVDDSSVIRKVARRILEGLDFQIVEAEDGEKALEVCKRGLSGGDQSEVVFCTPENGMNHIARALHAGANEYIMKPFTKEALGAKLDLLGVEYR